MKFYSENGMLLVQRKKIFFKKFTPAYYILDILFSTKDEYYTFGEMMGFQTVNEVIVSDGSTKELSDKDFYNKKDFINSKVFEAAKLKDFLIIKNEQIQANNDYIQK